MNAISGIFFRAVDMILKDCADSKVIFANGINEKSLGDLVAGKFQVEGVNYEGDYSEFGFTQGSFTNLCEKKVIDRFGLLSAPLILYYNAMRKRHFQCKDFRIWIEEGKNDGATNTLLGNDFWNAIITVSTIDFNDLIVLLLKGDDNSAKAKSIIVNTEMKKFWEDHGVQFKILLNPPVCKFVNWFWEEDGAHPDIVHRCLKVVSKLFESKEELEEYQNSIRDFLRSFRTYGEKEKAVGCAAKYYNCNFNLVEYMADYLNHFAWHPADRLWQDFVDSIAYTVDQGEFR
jgi:hypothetical protein